MKIIIVLIGLVLSLSSCQAQENNYGDLLSYCLNLEESQQSFHICKYPDTLVVVSQLDIQENLGSQLDVECVNNAFYKIESIYRELIPCSFDPRQIPKNILLLEELNLSDGIFSIRLWRPYSGATVAYKLKIEDDLITLESVLLGAY